MAHPRAWLTRVALNGATSWTRRRAAERRALTRHGPAEVLSFDADTADVVAIRAELAALPQRERRVVVTRFYGGFDVAETAAVLGMPEGTVKSLTHRAVGRLRRELATDREDDHVR